MMSRKGSFSIRKLMSPEEAVNLIKDGDTVTVSGMSGVNVPDLVLANLEARFLKTGRPQGLTVTGSSFEAGNGIERFAHEKMLKRYIGTWFYLYHRLRDLISGNKIEAYCFPLITHHHWIREIARGSVGLITHIGINTSYDPRILGGKLNESTKEDLVEIINLKGKEYLLYLSMPINVAIIRGTTADEDGNISQEKESFKAGVFYQAMAARNSGGVVIAQVERFARAGSIHPRMVEVPGTLVDAIVLDPKQPDNSAFPDRVIQGTTGEIEVPYPTINPIPLSAEKVIARRCCMEIGLGQNVNVGVGIPMRDITNVSIEEDIENLYRIMVEHGTYGGLSFAISQQINPTYFFSYSELLDFWNGGGLDLCFLGIGEVDVNGNLNIDRWRGNLVGAGGAPDIAYNAKKLVFCGTLTSGGVRHYVENGKITILKEGANKRFVKKTGWISINCKDLVQMGREVLFITERAVFKLTKEALLLTEIAPGIDIGRDVISQMEYTPSIRSDPKIMEAAIFREEKMGLRSRFDIPAAPGKKFRGPLLEIRGNFERIGTKTK